MFTGTKEPFEKSYKILCAISEFCGIRGNFLFFPSSQVWLPTDLILVERMHFLGCFVFVRAFRNIQQNAYFSMHSKYWWPIECALGRSIQGFAHYSECMDALGVMQRTASQKIAFERIFIAYLTHIYALSASQHGVVAPLHRMQLCDCRHKVSVKVSCHPLLVWLWSVRENWYITFLVW